MKRIITLSIAILCCVYIAAQLQPGYIPTQSPITLVYKITDAEARKLYGGNQKSVKEKMLHHCVDTLQGIADVLPDNYPDGHYLLVNAQGNNLHFRLKSAVPFEHRMLNNQTDMALTVFDRKTGKAVTDANVKVGGKRLSFDAKTQSFRKNKTDKQGMLSIEADDMTAYYTISRKYNTNWWQRAKSGLWNAPVVKYVSRPVIFVTSIPMDTYRSVRNMRPVGSIYIIQKPFADVYESIRWGNPHGWIDRLVDMFDNHSYSEGFIIFSKPKYRPNDTIRFKAYVANSKGKPINDSLSVYIQTDKRHKIGTIKPYRRGFYTMEFVPSASYGMKLDRNYSLYLTNGKISQSGTFYYEDYELKSVEYNIRSDKNEYLSHEDVIFYAKAVDENNMPVMDARAELILTADGIKDFNGSRIDIPDVLFKKEITLDPVGETKIVIPDSIWYDASIGVKMTALFSNSDNQTGRKEVRFLRKNTDECIVVNQHVDSLYIYSEKGGKRLDGVYAHIRRDILEDTLVVLPSHIKIHHLVKDYKIILADDSTGEQALLFLKNSNQNNTKDRYQSQFTSAQFTPSANNSNVVCAMSRLNDSIFISVENPLNLPLSYTIYKGNNEKQRGTGTLSTYKERASKKSYFLSVQYVWGGKEHQLEYRSSFDDTQLNINTSLPTVAFPGQTVTVNIVTTDDNGNPVPNVDLTAWGFTSKFGTRPMPNIPSYTKPPAGRKSHNAFASNTYASIGKNKNLDFTQWREPLKLDSTELYKFAYPGKEIYSCSFPASDRQTYIAPYLVYNGKLLPVQILYINDRPVYFSRTTTDVPYVFPVSAGSHVIRMRTNDFEVTAKVSVKRGHKNIISIDPYQWDFEPYQSKLKDADWGNIDKKQQKYTSNELDLMRSYLMPIRYQPNGKFVWLQYENTYNILKPERIRDKNSYKYLSVAAPIRQNTLVTLWEEDKKILSFERDNSDWFEYEPSQDILKMRTVPFSDSFDYKFPRFEWNALPYTRHYVDSMLNIKTIDRGQREIRYNNPAKLKNNKQLQVETTMSDSLKNEGWCWILYDYTLNGSLFYRLDEHNFDIRSNGLHALFLLMADKTFYLCDSIYLATNATTIMRLPVEDMQYSEIPIDSVSSSHSLSHDIYSYGGMRTYAPLTPRAQPQDAIVEYNPEYATSVEVCGRVTDESGEPVIGATVFVKGTSVGMATDINGNYCIRVPQGYRTLAFSFIGYATEERTLLQDGRADIVLKEDRVTLDEVIVVAYGRMQKSIVTGSVSSSLASALSGRAAGVSVSESGTFGSAPNIRVRGTTSIYPDSQPLYVVDGMIVTDISHLSQDDIASMNVLKDASATALYGSRAINGAVIITTKYSGAAVVDAQELMKQILEDEAYQTGLASAKGLRTNFSDEALWQPSLTTNNAGMASFTTTFPDDVTKWDIRFAGIIPQKASAVSQTQVRSFKPLMGQLAVPRFMVENDTANIIGKVINYGSDTVSLKIDFAIDDVVKIHKQEDVRHSLIDTLTVVALETLLTSVPTSFYDFADSVAVRYQLTRNDGYQDGEERHIPIVRRGTAESVGEFHVLDTDTTIAISLNAGESPVTLLLENTSLDILLKETRRLSDYQHLCNEQTASRLKALLLERKAYQFLNKDYPYDSHIRSLIDRLIKGRNNQGLWGWFGNGTQETWISTHATEALLQAREDGFNVEMDFEAITNRLIISFDNSSNLGRIRLLDLLRRINPESNYVDMFDKIDTAKFTYYMDMLRWMELSLHFERKPDVQNILEQMQADRFGNINWPEPDKSHWRHNDVSVTLAAYRLLRSTDGHDETLLKIRNYLFIQRKHSGWSNTFETAEILTTIMPDILASGERPGHPQVRIDGAYTAVVDTFPKHIVLSSGKSVTIDKKGSFPVYVTAWQEIYQRDPAPANESFSVETRFVANDGVKTQNIASLLTAGKTATLEVTVSSDISSEYVMIEIPIPAGCSYQSKPQSTYWRMGETHREYFRDRVCIYMRNLSKGAHTFRVELMPRYTGTYHVNPAKAECMYMPLYYGRTGVKKVKVKD